MLDPEELAGLHPSEHALSIFAAAVAAGMATRLPEFTDPARAAELERALKAAAQATTELATVLGASPTLVLELTLKVAELFAK